SRHQGRMHACGHDGHTAMLLGAARYLAETRTFDGTVNLIFQPAEEGLGGGEAMVKDGLFERFPCDAIFGMHNRPGLAIGKFQIRTGPMMAGGATSISPSPAAARTAPAPRPGSIRSLSRATSRRRCRRSSHAMSGRSTPQSSALPRSMPATPTM